MKLTITTVREFDDQAYKDYKLWMATLPVNIDWKKLERCEPFEIDTHVVGENVLTTYKLTK